MSQQDLERHIREQLQQHESPVNPEAIWEQIADRVPKKKKRRILGWWVFLGLGLLAAIGWIGSSLTRPEEIKLPTQVTLNTEKSGSNLSDERIDSPEEKTIAATKSSGIQDNTGSDQLVQKKLSNETNKTSVLSNFSTSIPKIESRASSLVSSQKSQSGLQTGREVQNQQSNTPSTPAFAEVAISSLSNADMQQKAIPSETTLSSDEAENLLHQAWVISPIASLNLRAIYGEFAEPSLETPKVLATEEYYKRHKKNNLRWSVGLDGGLSRISRTLTQRDSFSDYATLRRNSETPLEAVHLGINTQIDLPIGLYFQTGLNYTRINEKFENATSFSQTDTIEGIQEIYIGPNNDSSFVTGPVPITRVTSYQKRTYNAHSMLDVPLIVGYRLGSEKWSLLTEGGVFFNLQLKSEGTIAAEDDRFIDLSTGTPEVFRANLGLSYHLGLGVHYSITPKLGLDVKANFRFFPESFTVDSYAIEQKYTLIGARLGLRYYIN